MRWSWEEDAFCPETHSCSDGLVSFDIGRVPSYLNIVSSSLSCMGSILIIITYLVLRDMRTGAQTVITLLAIADFFTAFGYIIGSSNFISAFDSKDPAACSIFTSICEIQSFITTWSTMSSYCWTCILAFYFFLVLVYQKSSLAAKLLPLYNIIAWLGPLCIVGPMLVFGKLGYAPYVASNWCYIKDTAATPLTKKKWEVIVYILLGGKLWEVMSYVIVLVLYIRIRWSFRKARLTFSIPNVLLQSQGIIQESPSSPRSRFSSRSNMVDKRLLAIPLIYICLRMWGTLQFFYSLAVAKTQHGGCIPQLVQVGYFIFGLFQAVGDGGQGWGNAVLYIFFSPVIRSRLFKEPLEDCYDSIKDKLRKRDEYGSGLIYSGEAHGTSSPSPLVVATEAKGYKIQEYNDVNMTSVSTGGSSIVTGLGSKSERHDSFRPPSTQASKLINSQ